MVIFFPGRRDGRRRSGALRARGGIGLQMCRYRWVGVDAKKWKERAEKGIGEKKLLSRFQRFLFLVLGKARCCPLGIFFPFPFFIRRKKKKRKEAPPLQFLSIFCTVSFPLFLRQVRPEGLCPSSLRRSHLGREGAELRGTQSGTVKSRTASCSCRNCRGRIRKSP